MVELLLKGFFLVYGWPSSRCILTWARKEASKKGRCGGRGEREREREKSSLFFSF